MSIKTEDCGRFLVELAEKHGVACSTVKDGHVLIFTKAHLQMLMEKIESSGHDKCIVFVKRPSISN